MTLTWNAFSRMLVLTQLLISHTLGCSDGIEPRSDSGPGITDGGQIVDGSASEMDGGAPEGPDAGPRQGMVFELRVGTVGPNAESGCLAYVGGEWRSTSTDFSSEMGQANNPECVLVPVYWSSESQGYWVSGNRYDVVLMNNAFDDDPVRHAISTAEDGIEAGAFELQLFPFEESFDSEPSLATVLLRVGPYVPGDATVAVSVEPIG